MSYFCFHLNKELELLDCCVVNIIDSLVPAVKSLVYLYTAELFTLTYFVVLSPLTRNSCDEQSHLSFSYVPK